MILNEDLSSGWVVVRSTAIPELIEEWIPVTLSVKFKFPVNVTTLERATTIELT